MLIVKLVGLVVFASIALKISKRIKKGYVRGKRAIKRAKYKIASLYALASFPFYNEIIGVAKFIVNSIQL